VLNLFKSLYCVTGILEGTDIPAIVHIPLCRDHKIGTDHVTAVIPLEDHMLQ